MAKNDNENIFVKWRFFTLIIIALFGALGGSGTLIYSQSVQVNANKINIRNNLERIKKNEIIISKMYDKIVDIDKKTSIIIAEMRK